jgi:hypothetical protein
LLDLYVYYAATGMNTSSPVLRATALSILPPIAQNSPNMVFNLINRLIELTNDDWWDIHAQIVVICSQLLYHVEASDERSAEIYNLIHTCLLKQKNPNMQTIVLSYTAPHLKLHPSLIDMYTITLLNLPEDERVSLLEQPSDAIDILQLGSSCSYNIVSIPFTWYSIGIVKSLTNYIVSKELDNYEIQHYDILNACVSTVGNLCGELENAQEYQEWLQIFKKNQNHLYVGLCDEDLCEMAAQLLVKFYKLLKDDALKSIPLLLRIIELIYGKGRVDSGNTSQMSLRCQEVVANFLIAVYDLGAPFSDSIRKLRESFMDQGMEMTPMRTFLNYLSC